MDQALSNAILTYVQANYQSLIVGAVVVWLSFIVLGALLRVVIRIVGWFGSYLVGIIPGAIVYAVNYYFFDIHTNEATLQAGVAALLVGLLGHVLGRR